MSEKLTFEGKKIRCKLCGEVIQSKYRWNMVWCRCRALAIDGGSCYTRILGNKEDYEWVTDGDTKGIDQD